MATEMTVDYLGGDPDVRAAPIAGKLALTPPGFAFVGAIARGVNFEEVRFAIPDEELRAVSHGDANHMRGLSRGAAGVLIGGTIGGIIGMMTGKRNTMFALACNRNGFDFVAMFSCTADDGRWFIGELQRSRRDTGASAVPRIEDLAGQAAQAAADGQAEILGRVLAQLEEQTALLRRLVERG